MGEKSDKSVINTRVREIAELKIKGYSRAEILQYASKIIERDGAIIKEDWDVSERQVDEYIKRANAMIEASNMESLHYHTAIAQRRFDTIYNKCMQQENFGVALAAVKEYSELFGLKKQPQKQSDAHVTVNIIDNINDAGEPHGTT